MNFDHENTKLLLLLFVGVMGFIVFIAIELSFRQFVAELYLKSVTDQFKVLNTHLESIIKILNTQGREMN